MCVGLDYFVKVVVLFYGEKLEKSKGVRQGVLCKANLFMLGLKTTPIEYFCLKLMTIRMPFKVKRITYILFIFGMIIKINTLHSSLIGINLCGVKLFYCVIWLCTL